MIKIYQIIIIAFMVLLFNCKEEDNSSTIETLDGTKISVKDFDNAYNTAIDAMSRMQNIEKKNLIEFIQKNIDEVPEQYKPLNYQFQKKNFYDSYRQMMMTKIVADKTGFTTRPDIKEILKQVEMQTLYNLYLQEQVEKKIKITDELADQECQKLRSESKQLATLDVEKCIMYARGKLKQDESQKVLPKILDRIKEGVSIKHNEKFDLDQYLSNNTINTGTTTSISTSTNTEPKK